MLIVGATSKGHVRPNNEDAYWFNDQCAVVCDGMGGHQGGETASQMAVEIISEHSFSFIAPGEEISTVIQRAHRAIASAASEQLHLAGMGTTVTFAAVLGKRLFIGHVGDSRAYLFRRGTLKQLTTDHSVVQELVRKGALAPNEVDVHPQRNVLTQALGNGTVSVDIVECDLDSHDTILLCSDGLTHVLPDEEIAKILLRVPPNKAADVLVAAADEAGGPDNTTVILVHIQNTGESDR